MRALALAVAGLATGSFAVIGTNSQGRATRAILYARQTKTPDIGSPEDLVLAAINKRVDIEEDNIWPCDCGPHTRCYNVNGIQQCLMGDIECELYTPTPRCTMLISSPSAAIVARSASEPCSTASTNVTSTTSDIAAKERLSTLWSTETLASTTVTWSNAQKESGSTAGPGIATTSYDELSQTLVTETVPASPTLAQPSCDADGNCIFPPGCVVSFPGFISCTGDGGVSTTTHAKRSPTSTIPTTSRTTTATATPLAANFSDTKLATMTFSAAAAKNVVALRAISSMMSSMVMGSATPSSHSGCSTSYSAMFVLDPVPAAQTASPVPQSGGDPTTGGLDSMIPLRVIDEVLHDREGRMAYFADNNELEFNSTVAPNAPGVYGWSACSDGFLAFDGYTYFCYCTGSPQPGIYRPSSTCSQGCGNAQLRMVTSAQGPMSPTPISTSLAPPNTSASSTVTGGLASTTTVYVTAVVTESVCARSALSANGTATSIPAVTSGPSIYVERSQRGRCGQAYNQTCLGSSFGECCSTHGWCDNSEDYCVVKNRNSDFTYSGCGSVPEAIAMPSGQPEFEHVADVSIFPRQDSGYPTCGLPDHTCFDNPHRDCCSVYSWCRSGPAYSTSNITCDPDWGYCDEASHGSDASQYVVHNKTWYNYQAHHAAQEYEKHQVAVSPLVSALESIADLQGKLSWFSCCGPEKRQERTTVATVYTATMVEAQTTVNVNEAATPAVQKSASSSTADRVTTAAQEHVKRQVDVSPLVSAIESVAGAESCAESAAGLRSVLEYGCCGPDKREERTTAAAVDAAEASQPSRPMQSRSLTVQTTLDVNEAKTTVVQNSTSGSMGSSTASHDEGAKVTTAVDLGTTKVTMTGFPAYECTTVGGIINCYRREPAENASQPSYVPWSTAGPIAGYSTVSANHSSGITMSNPLRPGWFMTVSDPSALNPHINNTSTDTQSYLNIFTFVAPHSSSPTKLKITEATSGRGTTTSTKIVRPSATETDPTNTGLMGFMPVATSNIGNHSSGALAMAEIPGFRHVVGAGVAIVGLCFGVALVL